MHHIGKPQYDDWKKGKRLSRQKQIDAHCYECNGFEDSGEDCLGEKSCPLYPYSPSAVKRGYIDGYKPNMLPEKRKAVFAKCGTILNKERSKLRADS